MTDALRRRPVEEQLDTRLGTYYLDRIRIHMDDEYAGVRMRKFPEDLRVIEQLLWERQVDTVLEIGLGHGGSALWLRDRLAALVRYGRASAPLVISVDWDISIGRENLERADPAYAETIRLIESDIRDPDVSGRVRACLPAGARLLVIDDSAHRYDTTLATLRNFALLVPVGGFVVVEDGHRDIPGMLPAELPGEANGVRAAIADWLAADAAARFVPRRDQERYVVTSNPGGWLERVA